MAYRVDFDKETAERLLKNIIVLVDSREQNNKHILDYFDTKSIKYEVKKLDFGDYSFKVDTGVVVWTFDRDFVIERKNSLEELSGNLAQERERFEKELTRAKLSNTSLNLIVESGNWKDIIKHNYKTEMQPKSYFASLMTFIARYGISIDFVDKEMMGQFIFARMYYYLKNYLNGGV